MSVSRRTFLGAAAASAAFSGYARLAHAQAAPAESYRSEVAGYGPLEKDPFGVFDLPKGFSYRVVSTAGQEMDDGLLVPFKADGMACFPGRAGEVILTRNHELKATDRNFGPLGVAQQLDGHAARGPFGMGREGKLDRELAYDLDANGRPLPGGVSIIRYDLRTQRTVRQHLALAGTAVNCAGGRTPWGSWLTCEETLIKPGEGGSKLHGWVFEVPANSRGLVKAEPLKAMGRFMHEAAAVDPKSGAVYMTEDSWDNRGLLYRFLPNTPGELHKGGRLQAMGFRDLPEGGDTSNHEQRVWSQGDWKDVVWIDLDAVDNPDNDLAVRGRGKGCVYLARGEGIHWGAGELYLTATAGGAAKAGQIMRYVPSPVEGQPGEKDQPGRIQLFVESGDKSIYDYGDNLTVSPWGHLFVCEDRYSKDLPNHLRAVTPEGKVYTFGRNMFRDNAEIAGVCFSPDGSTLFVNIYWPGITLAITGPWTEFRS